MLINAGILDAAFKGFKTSFNAAFEGAQSFRETVAMTINSRTTEMVYGWLGAMPAIREWVGDRHLNQLSAHGFTIKNRKFESTIVVKRDDIADDQIGIYAPMFSELGRTTKLHPDELLFGILEDGFGLPCYDGQYFFDADHAGQPDNAGGFVSVSNTQAGSADPWFLLDLSRAVKPLIWQTREPYELQSVSDFKDVHVFMRDEFLYGVRARANCGFGLWQLAFGSKAVLDETNLKAAYEAMTSFKGENGKLLGVRPTHLVVGNSNMFKAREMLKSDQIAGSSNPLKDLVELIVAPILA